MNRLPPLQSSALRFFNDLQTRGERLRPPKSLKTALFVDRIVDRESNLTFSEEPRFAPSCVITSLPFDALLVKSFSRCTQVRRFAQKDSSGPSQQGRGKRRAVPTTSQIGYTPNCANRSKRGNRHCKGPMSSLFRGEKCAETAEMESTTGVNRQSITHAVDVQTPIWSTGRAKPRFGLPEPAASVS